MALDFHKGDWKTGVVGAGALALFAATCPTQGCVPDSFETSDDDSALDLGPFEEGPLTPFEADQTYLRDEIQVILDNTGDDEIDRQWGKNWPVTNAPWAGFTDRTFCDQEVGFDGVPGATGWALVLDTNKEDLQLYYLTNCSDELCVQETAYSARTFEPEELCTPDMTCAELFNRSFGPGCNNSSH